MLKISSEILKPLQYVSHGPICVSWTNMCLMNQYVSHGPICVSWTNMCLMDQYVSHGPICVSWTNMIKVLYFLSQSQCLNFCQIQHVVKCHFKSQIKFSTVLHTIKLDVLWNMIFCAEELEKKRLEEEERRKEEEEMMALMEEEERMRYEEQKRLEEEERVKQEELEKYALYLRQKIEHQ